LLPDADVYCTDGYDVYDRCLPVGRHVVDRAGVNRNEGKHSALRDYLVRLKRGTKACTRSVMMLIYSLALVALSKGWVRINLS
jgi:IS1 family transposase